MGRDRWPQLPTNVVLVDRLSGPVPDGLLAYEITAGMEEYKNNGRLCEMGNLAVNEQ
jgi:hypothetical protein